MLFSTTLSFLKTEVNEHAENLFESPWLLISEIYAPPTDEGLDSIHPLKYGGNRNSKDKIFTLKLILSDWIMI